VCRRRVRVRVCFIPFETRMDGFLRQWIPFLIYNPSKEVGTTKVTRAS
jgi:hypothetical protein